MVTSPFRTGLLQRTEFSLTSKLIQRWAVLKEEKLCSDRAHLPQPSGRCWCTAGPHQARDFYPAIKVKMEELWAEGEGVLFSAAGLPLYQVRETGKVQFEMASLWWVPAAQRSCPASSIPPPPALYFYCLKTPALTLIWLLRNWPHWKLTQSPT